MNPPITVAPPTPSKAAALAALRQHIRQLERLGGSARRAVAALPLLAPIDRLWPKGGLPLGCLHEAASDGSLAGTAALTAFFAAIAGRLSAQGMVVWCARARDADGSGFYAPGLAQVGLQAQNLLAVHARSDANLLAVMEEALSHSRLAAVVGEVERLSLTASRRLALAAEKSGVTALLLRTPPRIAAKHRDTEPIAAASRWRVTALPSGPHTIPESPESGVPRLRLELLQSRAGAVGEWIIEAPNAQGHFNLSSAVGHGSAATPHVAGGLRLAAG